MVGISYTSILAMVGGGVKRISTERIEHAIEIWNGVRALASPADRAVLNLAQGIVERRFAELRAALREALHWWEREQLLDIDANGERAVASERRAELRKLAEL
jgi:hypothetical protein